MTALQQALREAFAEVHAKGPEVVHEALHRKAIGAATAITDKIKGKRVAWAGERWKGSFKTGDND